MKAINLSGKLKLLLLHDGKVTQQTRDKIKEVNYLKNSEYFRNCQIRKNTQFYDWSIPVSLDVSSTLIYDSYNRPYCNYFFP